MQQSLVRTFRILVSGVYNGCDPLGSKSSSSSSWTSSTSIGSAFINGSMRSTFMMESSILSTTSALSELSILVICTNGGCTACGTAFGSSTFGWSAIGRCCNPCFVSSSLWVRYNLVVFVHRGPGCNIILYGGAVCIRSSNYGNSAVVKAFEVKRSCLTLDALACKQAGRFRRTPMMRTHTRTFW